MCGGGCGFTELEDEAEHVEDEEAEVAHPDDLGVGAIGDGV